MKSTGIVVSTTPGLFDVLVCPAGHKYEVIAAGMVTATGAAPNYQGFLFNRAGGLHWVRYKAGAADFVTDMDPLGPVVLEPGDKLQGFFTYTQADALVTYIDVDPG